ncbi:MAG: TonB-dependent receptor plug domain-containing protein, partial [bacterium]
SVSLLGLLYLWLIPGSQAQEIYRLEPVVISADRLAQPIDQVVSSVTVITQEDLARERAMRPDECIRGMPGFTVTSCGTIGEGTNLQVRGSNRNQTLVMIDGLKVNSPWYGAYREWGDTELADVERIEILRGTQSELYGSEALGGVIHLFTKRGKGDLTTTMTLGGGTFETWRESLELAGGGVRGDYLICLTQTDSEGQFDRDAYRSTQVTGRLGWQIHSLCSLSLISRYRETKKQYAINPDEFFMMNPEDLPRAYFWDEHGFHEDQFSLHSLTFTMDPYDWWHYQVNLGFLEHDGKTQKGLFKDTSNLSTEDILSHRLTVGTQHNFSRPESNNTLIVGLEYEKEAVDESWKFLGDPDTVIQSEGGIDYMSLFDDVKKDRHNLSLFCQNQIRAYPFILTAGFRWDHNSAYGNTLSPRFSGAWQAERTRTRLKTSWSRGFRAPTFQELYFPLYGNKDLNPEWDTSFEVGIEQPVVKALFIGCTLFQTSYKDLISTTSDGACNIGKATIDGLEGEISFNPLPKLEFQLFYTYLDSEDKIKGRELPRRPHHTWRIAADYQKGNFLIHPAVYIVSSELSTSSAHDTLGNSLKGRLPGHTRTDVTVQYQFPFRPAKGKGWQLYSRISNLFDEEYSGAPGWPAPGINVLVGLRAEF